MIARIYRPAKSAMTSGAANTKDWVLDFGADSPRPIDPLMGWTGATDMQAQVKLRFSSREEAVDYARARGVAVRVEEPHARKPNIRPRGYGSNFSHDRRAPWTH